ncbi:alpha/beta hydrolase [Fodinibius salsisoli]|uniref:Alpha/beta hydrolase n=1 Tax=Fodinibius salsisoli TaxID=2820877 RepID=A0ABT3PKX0_9BACT|nr:alpha/beta hydrolase [Fodinibius salsisoli]MCW9706595.1 alpha/beta hydrolase [Fodinibius salsisoli]
MSDIQRKAFLKKLSLLFGGAGISSWAGWKDLQAEPTEKENRVAPETEVTYLWEDGSENNGSNPDYRPKIEVYQPNLRSDDNERLPAVLICPGGGYHVQALHEGRPFARLLAMHGIVSAVLTYRVHPDGYPGPYADACRAMRILRRDADQYQIDPERIGIMGFSAGGHLASTVATQPDLYEEPEDDLVGTYSAEAQRVILGYPVISMGKYTHEGSLHALLGENPDPEMQEQLSNHKQVTEESPPAFLFHTADDSGVPVQNSMLYAQACVDHDVPVDLHVFSNGPHGVGMGLGDPKLEIWTDNLMAWLSDWTV